MAQPARFSISRKSPFRKILLYNWIGNFVESNQFQALPIGGEVVRIALAQKETKHDAGIAAATVDKFPHNQHLRLFRRINNSFYFSFALPTNFQVF